MIRSDPTHLHPKFNIFFFYENIIYSLKSPRLKKIFKKEEKTMCIKIIITKKKKIESYDKEKYYVANIFLLGLFKIILCKYYLWN